MSYLFQVNSVLNWRIQALERDLQGNFLDEVLVDKENRKALYGHNLHEDAMVENQLLDINQRMRL